MSPDNSALLVIDVQQKLVPAIRDGERVAFNVRRLVDGARLLGVAVTASEQYPKGLGPTLPQIAERLEGQPTEKMSFSAGGRSEIFADLLARDIHTVLVCGIETHVCVQQTVLDLLTSHWRVFVAVDAVGSRFAVDHETSLRRMEAAGAVPTTTESVLFEWCETAEHPHFKQISRLVREMGP